MYEVVFHDNVGPHDFVFEFETEDGAECYIEDAVIEMEENMAEKGVVIRVGDFGDKVELWVSGGDRYAEWRREWLQEPQKGE